MVFKMFPQLIKAYDNHVSDSGLVIKDGKIIFNKLSFGLLAFIISILSTLQYLYFSEIFFSSCNQILQVSPLGI